MNKLHDEKIELERMMADYDPYKEGFRVLDTDYDNFMIVYHCSDNDHEADLDSDEGIDE